VHRVDRALLGRQAAHRLLAQGVVAVLGP
jgi:hypothetical protein